MEKFFTIGQTAKIVNMTAETLRHYDRIGLVHPCKTDNWTGYRYYSEQEVVRLYAIGALRCMGLSLNEIKKVLEYDDIEKIVDFLKQAEKNADAKISELIDAKTKIQKVKMHYESKTADKNKLQNMTVKELPERTILLSNKLSTPSLDTLWNYHRHFYAQIGDEKRNDFSFEDLAGIYESNGISRLFAVCTQYSSTDNLLSLPAGKYLCADCTEDDYEDTLQLLLNRAKNYHSVIPSFTVRLIIISGILQWNYEIQIPINQ